MSAEHSEITIVTAEPFEDRLFVHFSDGTETLFHCRFLYEVREHKGNIEITNLSDQELMKGFEQLDYPPGKSIDRRADLGAVQHLRPVVPYIPNERIRRTHLLHPRSK